MKKLLEWIKCIFGFHDSKGDVTFLLPDRPLSIAEIERLKKDWNMAMSKPRPPLIVIDYKLKFIREFTCRNCGKKLIISNSNKKEVANGGTTSVE